MPRYDDFLIFPRWQPSAILDLLCVRLDHPRRAFGSVYRSAKFGWIKNSLLKFADDTKVFGKVSDPSDHFLLQDDINHLIEWSTDWQMLFNIDKYKVMHFGKKNQELCTT